MAVHVLALDVDWIVCWWHHLAILLDHGRNLCGLLGLVVLMSVLHLTFTVEGFDACSTAVNIG